MPSPSDAYDAKEFFWHLHLSLRFLGQDEDRLSCSAHHVLGVSSVFFSQPWSAYRTMYFVFESQERVSGITDINVSVVSLLNEIQLAL